VEGLVWISNSCHGPTHFHHAVDKIVIDQLALGRFINHVRPGAYVSLVEVDFKALDNIQVRPLGVYGSQSQIVKFMLSLNVVDSETYVDTAVAELPL
jgi:hypothetical protein